MQFGDLDNDGDVDLVVGLVTGNNLLVFQNNSGTLSQTAILSSVGQKSIRRNLSIADVNQDGWLDIIVTDNNVTATVRLFINNKNNLSTFFVDDSISSTKNAPGSLSTIDCNNDGILDILVGDGSAIALHLGIGNGKFYPKQLLSADIVVNNFVVGDLNADNKQDIVVYNTQVVGANVLQVLINNSSATISYTKQVTPFSSMVNTLTTVSLVDMDGDGDLDLVIGYNSSNRTNLGVVFNNTVAGSTTFSLSQQVYSNGINNYNGGILLITHDIHIFEWCNKRECEYLESEHSTNK